MFVKKQSFVCASLVAVLTVALAFVACGEVLVYEGFGPSDYTIGSGQSDQGTASNYPVTKPLVDAIGVGDSGNKWQGMGGSQIKVKLEAVKARVRVPDFKLWSPSAPNLHRLELTLAKGPALTVRFGIRTVEAKEGSVEELKDARFVN